MGAAGDLRAHQGGLRVKDVRVDSLQVIPALVVVAVAGGGGKVGGVDPVFLHGGQNLALVILRGPVNRVKPGTQGGQYRLAVFIYLPADAQMRVNLFHHSHSFCWFSSKYSRVFGK